MEETRVQADIETLQANFNQLRTDLQNLTSSIGEISRQRVEQGVESLRQTGNRAAERVREVAADASSLKDAGLAAAERQVAEHPITSLLAAFAAGMMVGKLVERR
jgi:ElaB/YqjD/DUF883 family membrane-anchored ribosome-binding protein